MMERLQKQSISSSICGLIQLSSVLALKILYFLPTASYGHFGRDSYSKNVDVYYEVPGSKPKAINGNGKMVYQKKVEFFAWEKLDYVDKIKKAFKLQ